MIVSHANKRPRTDAAMATETAMVFDIKRFAVHDGPGIRTTVFMKGCPLQCAWCHNPESQASNPEIMFMADRCTSCGNCVKACPQGAIRLSEQGAQTDRDRCTGCGQCVSVCESEARSLVGKRMPLPTLLAEIESDVAFFDESGGGVTLSGGEPLNQPGPTSTLLAECQALRIHTTLDTCGFAPWKDLSLVAQSVDLILFDLKTLNDAQHIRWTGQSNQPILDNLVRLDRLGKPLWIRIPFVPEMVGDPDQWQKLGEFAASLHSVEAIHVLPYHRGGEVKWRQLERAKGEAFTVPVDKAVSVAAKRIADASGHDVHIGG